MSSAVTGYAQEVVTSWMSGSSDLVNAKGSSMSVEIFSFTAVYELAAAYPHVTSPYPFGYCSLFPVAAGSAQNTMRHLHDEHQRLELGIQIHLLFPC